MSGEKSKRRRQMDPKAQRILGAIHTGIVELYYLLVPQDHIHLNNTKQERAKRLSVIFKAWRELRQFILERVQPPEDPAALQDREDQSEAGRITIDILKERDSARAEVRSLKLALCRYSLDQDGTLRIASAIEERAEGILKNIQ